MTVLIRAESESDYAAIWDVTKRAFEGRPFAAGDEQDLINSLRAGGALTISLVAVDEGHLIGQITFSPASISSGRGNWFALGPVSVVPSRQGEGVGGALIEAGMHELEHLGASGCILTGNPDYYSRHGFLLAPEHCPDEEPAEYFMLRLLVQEKPIGKFRFHEAFYEST